LIYLLLYVVFSSVFSLCIKWVYNRGSEDIITIGAINYIVAAIAIAPWYFTGVEQTGDTMAMVTGGTMGLVYFVAFFFVIYCVRVVGVSSTTVVGSLSLLLPIIVAAFVWDSTPNLIQIAGIGLALVSLLMIAVKPKTDKAIETGPEKDTEDWKQSGLLVGFFLLCGMSRIAQETFKYESVIDQKPTFLLTAFIVAGIPSLILLVYRFRPILKMEWVIGVIMGLSNGLQTFLILKSLDFIPGYIVFPLSSAGGIVFTTMVATLLLNERLRNRAYIGIAISVVALILLNWQQGSTSGEAPAAAENATHQANKIEN
jgi:drug/metabolite transporter (DMT)-like permease